VKLFSKIFVIFLLFCWATNISTSYYYVVYTFVLLLFFAIIFCKRIKIPTGRREDYIAFSFLLVWLYGISIGFLNGNNISYIMNNFAGMVCYASYFMFTKTRLTLHETSKLLIISGIIVCFISAYRMFSFVSGIRIPGFVWLVGSDVGISSTGQLRVYFSTLTIAYGLLGISLYTFFWPSKENQISFLNKRYISLLLFLLSFITLSFIASSKGFLLGGLFIICYVPFLTSLKSLKSFHINKMLFIYILMLLLIIVALIYFEYFSIIEYMFDREDASNKERYDQLYYLIKDCNFLGNGLGAIVPGSVRAEDAPYGFELTFINLIHKFGAFSLILFWGWLYMFFVLSKYIYTKKNLYYSIIAFCSLGYLFPSIGNPLLMHPSLVVLNCLTLYYIRTIRNE
jgi:hypothetical protein